MVKHKNKKEKRRQNKKRRKALKSINEALDFIIKVKTILEIIKEVSKWF
ncbi:hypothetical protein ONZ78_08870 [Lactobacillus mulieris]|nr:hypothetical protein [Lactobacillus mulieris]MCW8106874.1 hypothetical protein [Lactobacillus mulieris]MDK7349602.1 hypothetical protein [Lactobacillus mulieris]